MRLVPRGEVRGVRVLHADVDGVLAGRGNVLLGGPELGALHPHARPARAVPEDLAARARLLSRLLRLGFHDLAVLPDGALLAVLPYRIVRVAPDDDTYTEVFRVPRGTRPLGLAVTPAGHAYFGEYFGNRHHDEVHVYGSEDGGRTFDVCHTFPRGAVRHVHRVVYDPYRDGLLVLTGDDGAECRVLLTTDGFRTVDTLIAGGQEARAVAAIPLPDGVILPTDAPREPNFIQLLDGDGRLHRLAPLPGCCFFAGRAAGAVFLSTGIDPDSPAAEAALFGSADGHDWQQLLAWPASPLSGRLLQYGNVALPAGEHPTLLHATLVGLRGHDDVSLAWEVAP